MPATTSPKRQMDPGRRERVIEGVLTTIATHGVEGLTHRRVAETAGVSLSATTYYFGTLEGMLEEALRVATERDIAELREQFAGMAPAEVKDGLVAYVERAVETDRRQIAVITELYIAAIRRESLRSLVIDWENAWTELITPTLGAASESVSAAIGGALMRSLAYDDPARGSASIRALLDAMEPEPPRA